MSSDCTDVASDIEQRIVTLSSRIYSHQNLISQYTQEKERLECILANLQTDDGSGGGEGEVEGESDGGAVETNVVYHTSSTSMANDGPWQ